MSDGSASDAPNAASDEDAMLQHVMTLIEDDENGTVLKILQHAGVAHPLDLLMHSEKESDTMKAKINNKSTPMPFRNVKLLVLFKKFHVCRQAKQLPHRPNQWITEHTSDAFTEFGFSANSWDHDAGRPLNIKQTTSSSTSSTGHVADAVANFKKGIKRDPSLFEPPTATVLLPTSNQEARRIYCFD